MSVYDEEGNISIPEDNPHDIMKLIHQGLERNWGIPEKLRQALPMELAKLVLSKRDGSEKYKYGSNTRLKAMNLIAKLESQEIERTKAAIAMLRSDTPAVSVNVIGDASINQRRDRLAALRQRLRAIEDPSGHAEEAEGQGASPDGERPAIEGEVRAKPE